MHSRHASFPLLKTKQLSNKKIKVEREEERYESSNHPLQEVIGDLPTFASAIRDGTLTRPSLRRQLRNGSVNEVSVTPSSWSSVQRSRSYSGSTESELPDDWASTPGASSSEENPFGTVGETREVLVHQILPSDSLAGVALKYGVKVAALRKANKLWPSDSIHLRKVLYIPLDWQKWTKKNAIMELDESTPRNNSFFDPSERLDDPPSRPSNGAGPVLRRVPKSELSFFPPPTSAPQHSNRSRSSTLPRISSSASPLPNSNSYHRSHSSTTSLFGVFSSGIESLARMSTESLSSSLPRTSISEEAEAGEVELDLANDTWQSTSASTSTLILPRGRVSPTTPRLSPMKPPNGVSSSRVSVVSRQPITSPQMMIPGTAKR